MTLEADLVALLTSDYDIRDAINDVSANELRIYPDERPADQKNLRAIVYTVIAGTPSANLENGDPSGDAGDLEQVRVQLDLFAASRAAAIELRRLVQSRMNAGNVSIRAVRLSRQSDIDPETRERREILDYSVWHSPQ